MIPDDEPDGPSEFALLAGNAEQAGVAGPLPAVERIRTGTVSALRWGSAPPRVVFLHGGAQNAHTWDTVILGLGEPALAVDLPGHGRSDWRDDGDYSPQRNAAALAPVLRELAPAAELVVGMSLGGLTAIRLAATAPDLVRRLTVVDVTPSALQRHSQMSAADRGTVALAQGDRTFPDFESLLALTMAAAPHRDPESLRRGLFHNTRRLPDGRWTWRYDTIRTVGDFAPLWTDVSAVRAPTTLIRGGDSGFVTDEDVAEYARRSPGLAVHVVAGSGIRCKAISPGLWSNCCTRRYRDEVSRPRIGVQLQPQHAPQYRAIRDAVRRCEDLGVDIAFNWDHFFPLYGDRDGPHFECWTMLGAWAEQTSRIEIGALVSCNSYRNPELLADMARTVDHIGGGRLILGVGSGWKHRDYREYGYEFGTAGSRLDDLADALPRIKSRLAQLNPQPTRPLPMMIGGGGERKTLRLVAEHADMWHSFATAEDYPHKAAVLAEHCAAVGRDPGAIEHSAALGGDQTLGTVNELLAEADALTGLGVRLLTIGCTGPDYDLTAAEALCRWRDQQ